MDEGNVHHDGDAADIITAGNPAILIDGGSVAGDPAFLMKMAPDTLGDSGSETEASDMAESFRRSRRVRKPNTRLQDFEVELPPSLVVEAINTVMEPQTVQQALMEPDADK